MWEMMTLFCFGDTWHFRRRGLFEYKKNRVESASLFNSPSSQHVPSIEDTRLTLPLFPLLCLLPIHRPHPPLSTFRFRRGQKVGIWHRHRYRYVLFLFLPFFLSYDSSLDLGTTYAIFNTRFVHDSWPLLTTFPLLLVIPVLRACLCFRLVDIPTL